MCPWRCGSSGEDDHWISRYHSALFIFSTVASCGGFFFGLDIHRTIAIVGTILFLVDQHQSPITCAHRYGLEAKEVF